MNEKKLESQMSKIIDNGKVKDDKSGEKIIQKEKIEVGNVKS